MNFLQKTKIPFLAFLAIVISINVKATGVGKGFSPPKDPVGNYLAAAVVIFFIIFGYFIVTGKYELNIIQGKFVAAGLIIALVASLLKLVVA